MKTAISILLSLTFFIGTQASAQPLDINYEYKANVPRDMSMMSDGPLSLAEFSDHRDDASASQILVNGEVHETSRPLASLLRDAFEQGFQAANADMAESHDSSMVFQATVLEFAIESGDQGLSVLLRADASLNNSGRTAWNSVLFSQVETETQDIETAIAEAFDRMLRELWWDDYFFMEFGIF